MSVKQVTPEEANELMQAGRKFIDVRSVAEFETGHPSGAYNVPISHKTPQGMAPNAEFLDVMRKNFGKDEVLILSCRSGNRSLRAAELLIADGFTRVLDMHSGFNGWQPRGLPVATSAESGRSWAELQARAG